MAKEEHTMFIFGIVFQNVITLMSSEKQHFGGPLLVPKIKYLVVLMIKFSTRQMIYFDILQNAKRFRPITYRLRHTAISTKGVKVAVQQGKVERAVTNKVEVQ